MYSSIIGSPARVRRTSIALLSSIRLRQSVVYAHLAESMDADEIPARRIPTMFSPRA